jgi:hypothetical protein
MRGIGEAATGQLRFVRGFTRYQWLVFFVVWAGWSLSSRELDALFGKLSV